MKEKLVKNLTIIIGSSDNWKAYRKIVLEALKSEPEAYRNSYKEMLAFTKSDWERRLADKNSVIVFAKRRDIITGMAGIIFSNVKKVSHNAKVFEVYIKPHYRHFGAGKQLISAIENIAVNKGIIKLRLFVNTECNYAISLYEKLGFKKVGFLEKELKIDAKYFDEYIMEKFITKRR